VVIVVDDVDEVLDVDVLDVDVLVEVDVDEELVVVPACASGRMIVKNASLVCSMVRLVVTRTVQVRQFGSPLPGSGSFGDRQLNLPPCGFSPLNGNNRWLSSSAANVALPLASVFTGALPVAASQWSFGSHVVGGAGCGSEPSHCSMKRNVETCAVLAGNPATDTVNAAGLPSASAAGTENGLVLGAVKVVTA
jgi:hypothetical protein